MNDRERQETMTDPLNSPAAHVRTMFAATLTAHLAHNLSADEMRQVAALSDADAEWDGLFGYQAWSDVCRAYAAFMRAMARQAEGSGDVTGS